MLEKLVLWDLSGSPVNKNPPANAGDASSTLHSMEQVSRRATTEPVCHKKRSPCTAAKIPHAETETQHS